MTDRLGAGAMKCVNLGLTGYDACYVALASSLGGLWLTFDGKEHRQLADPGLSVDLEADIPHWKNEEV